MPSTAPTVVVVVASGSEEMEAVIVVDCLRRASINVVVAGLDGTEPVVCSRNVNIVPDIGFGTITDWSTIHCIVLPGGMGGARAFEKSSNLHAVLQSFYQSGKIVAAICAAPIALKAAQIGQDRSGTSYPSVADELMSGPQPAFKNYVDNQAVVVDGNLVTSRGPGTAFDFALALIEILSGKEAKAKTQGPLLVSASNLFGCQ